MMRLVPMGMDITTLEGSKMQSANIKVLNTNNIYHTTIKGQMPSSSSSYAHLLKLRAEGPRYDTKCRRPEAAK